MGNKQKTVCLITGGAKGIGRATAELLRDNGYEVLVADLPECIPPQGTIHLKGDLSLLSDVATVCGLVADKYPKLDILINNVGAIFPEREETSEGIEKTFALGHLSWFYTTLNLLPLLRNAKSAKIINVGSSHYRAGSINFDDLEFKQRYNMTKAYCQCKLANMMFTFKLSKLVESSGITTNILHPGAVRTGFGDNLRGFWRKMWNASAFVRRSPEAVAKEIYELISKPEYESLTGQYFVRGKCAKILDKAQDPIAANKLWSLSLKTVYPHKKT